MTRSVEQRSFWKVLKAFDGLISKSVHIVLFVRTVQPPSPLHSLCLCYKTSYTALCLLQCLYTHGMNLTLILHRTITKSGNGLLVKDQSFKRLFLDVLALTTFISHLYIKEWILEEQQDSTTFWKRQNSVKIVQHPKFT